ncbi:MAG: ABC transporter permease [Rhodobacteraceae bacterium]|nr:ABC transporter permease [Paracoccaceae bacterium]
MMSQRWRRSPGLGPYAFVMLAFLYAPLLVLGVYAFNGGTLVTVWDGLSLRWFRAVLVNDDIRRAAVNSVLVATVATLVATAIATLTALTLETLSTRRSGFMAGLVALPLIVPEIVTAVTTLVFFASIHLRLGLGNLILAHIVFCIPFAMMPIRARLQGLGDGLHNAARDLYAPPVAVFRRVTLPLLAPGIVSGALLSFVVSLDDFVLSALLGDAGTTTLPVYVYGMIRRGITPEVNAISTLLLVVSLALAAVAQGLNRPRRAPKSKNISQQETSTP